MATNGNYGCLQGALSLWIEIPYVTSWFGAHCSVVPDAPWHMPQMPVKQSKLWQGLQPVEAA